jgi:Zn-dependent peptidase ImmA (M78 family)
VPWQFFLRTRQIVLERPVYRKRSSLPKKQEAAIMGKVQEWLERYLDVEELLPSQDMAFFDLPGCLSGERMSSMEDIERLSEKLREVWDLGLAPIENLTALLESKGIRILLVEADAKFDACTYFTEGGKVPVIVVREGQPGDRQRFSTAHELGHYVIEVAAELSPELDPERAASRFAAAFLAPREAAYRELGRSRRALSWKEMLILKDKYGLSIQAWVYRARDLGIISSSTFRRAYQGLSTRHLRLEEPGDVPAEKPQRMEQLVYRALAEELITRSRAAELLGCSLAMFFDEYDPARDERVAEIGSGEMAYVRDPTRVRH